MNCLVCGKELIGVQKKYCSKKCAGIGKHNQYIQEWKAGKQDGLKGEYGISIHIRKYLLDKYNCRCQLCGWGEQNPFTKTLPLEVHHIDGNYKNNKEDNLQLLCPNCHSLTNTFKSHNIFGRSGREKYYKRSNKDTPEEINQQD